MNDYEILDKIREVNGPIPDLEPQIVNSTSLLTAYASVLLRRSEDDYYLNFCLNWDLPVDWVASSGQDKTPLQPNEVAFTHEGQLKILKLTREDLNRGGYAVDLLNHLVDLGPGALTPRIKKKLFELTKFADLSVRGPTEWDENTYIQIPPFFSLLRAGYFMPEDEKIGREIADDLGRKAINAYYNAAISIRRDGGEVVTRGLENLLACASPEVYNGFLNALKAVIGTRYRELNSRGAIAAINKLSGEAQRRAIEKHKEDIVKLLRSIP